MPRENKTIGKMCTTVNIVNLLTEFVTYTHKERHTHKITCHFHIERLKPLYTQQASTCRTENITFLPTSGRFVAIKPEPFCSFFFMHFQLNHFLSLFLKFRMFLQNIPLFSYYKLSFRMQTN